MRTDDAGPRVGRPILVSLLAAAALILAIGAVALLVLARSQTQLLRDAEIASRYHLASMLHVAKVELELRTVRRQVLRSAEQDPDGSPALFVRRSLPIIDRHLEQLRSAHDRFGDAPFDGALRRVIDQRDRYADLTSADRPGDPPPGRILARIDQFETRLDQLSELHALVHATGDPGSAQAVVWRRFRLAALVVVVSGLLIVLLMGRQIRATLRERRVMSADLRESEARFRQIVESINDVFWITSADPSETLYVSPAYERIWGVPWEEIRGDRKAWLRAIHPDDRPGVEQALAGHEDEGRIDLQYRIVRPDGSIRWIRDRGAPIRGVDGAVLRHAGIAEDVTERVEAEAERRKLVSLVERSEDFIGIATLDGKPVYLNAGGRRMVGLDELEPLTGMSIFEFIPEESQQRIREIVLPETRRRGFWRGEFELCSREDQTPIPVEMNSFLIPDPVTGEPIALANVSRDISERKRAEERQRLMMAELDHRVKNNLAAVLSLAKQTMSGASTLDEFSVAFQGRIAAMAATHEALATARWEGVDMRRAASIILASHLDVDFSRITVKGGAVQLPAEAVMPICLILHELCTNAIKHGALGDGDGRIELSWRTTAGRVELSWVERGGPIVTSPTMSGMGTRLIDGFVRYELRGEVEMDYRPEGLACRISVPLDRNVAGTGARQDPELTPTTP